MNYTVELITSMSKVDNKYNKYIIRVKVKGNLVMEVSEDFGIILETLINGGIRKLIIDIKELSYIDSIGIKVFIKVAKVIRSKKGDIILTNAPAEIEEIFKLVHLNDFIKNYRIEKQALDYLFSVTAAE